MESAEAEVRYVIFTKVAELTEEFRNFVEKSGTQYVPKQKSIGWYILLEGSHEKLFLGTNRPQLSKGDNVRITIEPMDKAQCLPLISINPTTTPNS